MYKFKNIVIKPKLVGFLIFLFCVFSLQAQITAPVNTAQAALDTTTQTQPANGMTSPDYEHVYNGSGSLGQTYNFSAVGLEYVTSTLRLGQRAPLAGVSQPATYTVSGIPANACIQAAFMYASSSVDINAPNFNVSITNPNSQSFSYSPQLIGSGTTKCWPGYDSTHSYRIDVTSCIAGNGSYVISGFPTNTPEDIDGSTLIIIYTNPGNPNLGTLVMNDGAIVILGGSTSSTISGFSIASTPSNVKAFIMIGDIQANTGVNFGGTNVNYIYNWWNYVEGTPSASVGQTSITYTTTTGGDCYDWVVSGFYWQEIAPPLSFSAPPTLTNTTCGNCIGAAQVYVTGGSGNYTYSWTGNVSTNDSASNLCAGNYIITVHDGSGCSLDSITDTLTISNIGDSSFINILNQDTAICSGSSLTLNTSVANSGGTYSWQPGGSSDSDITVTPTNTTTYYVTYADSSCTSTDSVKVSVFTGPTVTTIDTTICNAGDTITLPAVPNVPGGSYTWSPGGQTTQNIQVTPTITTNYIVNYTVTGCPGFATDTATVTVNTPLTITITGDDSICLGDSTILTAAGGISYNWSDSLGTANPVSTFPSATHTFGLMAIDSNDCHDTANYTVNVLPLPTVTITGDSGICQGDTTTLLASGANTYTWTPGGNTDSITVSPNTNTTYMIVGTDAFGCSDTETVSIAVSQPPNINITGDTILCIGDPSILTCTSMGSGLSYQWSTGANTSAIQVNPTGDTTYYLTVTNVAGCAAEDSIYIHVNPLPNITISGDTALCSGNTTTLTANGGNSYTWQPGGQITDSITVPIGNYSVTGTDANGCTNSASVNVSNYPSPVTNFSFNPDSACGRACVQFANNSSIQSGTMNYYWIFGDGDTSTSNNPNHCFDLNNGNIVTTYFPKLIATSNAGCKDSLTSPTPVVVLPIPTASFVISPTPPVKPNTTLKFTSTSTDAYSYLWESNDGQSDTDSIATFKYSAPGTYSVCLTVTNIYGCEDSACENIEVQDDFFMPNVITPNGDGINDNLVIKGLPIEGNNAITIYDRWGKKIYHSDNYKNDWGGTNKGGKKLSDGTYYYILLLGNDKKQTGYITILD